MNILLWTLLAVLCLALSAFFSGSEIGLYTVNHFRLRRRAHVGERSAQVLSWLLSQPTGLLITILVGNNIVNFGLVAIATMMYNSAGFDPGQGWWRSPDVLAAFTLVLPVFLAGEMLPKNWFRRHTERLSYVAAWGLAATKIVLYPIVWPLKVIATLLPARFGPGAGLGLPRITRHIIDHLLSRGRETGELTAEQERLARNALRAGEIRVARLARKLDGSCCTPESEKTMSPGMRTLTVPADEIGGRVLQSMTASRARLALVLDRRSGGIGDGQAALTDREVLGYVRLFDLLAPGAQGRPMRELARPVPRLAAQVTLRTALNTMQRECADVAVVEGPTPGTGRKAVRAAAGAAETRPVLGVVRLAQLIAELSAAPDARPRTPATGDWPAVPAR